MFGPTQLTCNIRQQCIALSHEHHMQFLFNRKPKYSQGFTGTFSGALSLNCTSRKLPKNIPVIKQEIQH